MPATKTAKNLPVNASGTVRTAGRHTVVYRDTRGRTRNAEVTGPGAGANQLNLRIRYGGRGTTRTLTNVPMATARTQTNVWFNRGRAAVTS